MQLLHSGNQCPHCTINFRSEDDLSQHISNLHPEVTASKPEVSASKKADEEPMLKLDEEEEEEPAA